VTTDCEAVRRSRDGPRALGDLFYRHVAVVARYIARRAGTDVADEVMSETFLVTFERRDRFDHAHTSSGIYAPRSRSGGLGLVFIY
jgi:RNA polymerase sigma-70 factor (ECF subfamily)